MTHNYLEKLKPFMLAMTLDYSVIPEINMEMAFALIQAEVENNSGRDGSGSLVTAFDTIQAIAEANQGQDVSSISNSLTLGNLDVSVEGNGAKEVSLEQELGLSQGISVEQHSTEEISLDGENGFVVEIGTEHQKPTEITSTISVGETIGIGAEGNATQELTLAETMTFTANATAQAYAQVIKSATAEHESGFTISATPEADVGHDMTPEFEIASDINIVVERPISFNLKLNKDMVVEAMVTALKMKYGVISDYNGQTITEVCGNKTIDQASRIVV